MKKIILGILLAALVVTSVACGKSATSNSGRPITTTAGITRTATTTQIMVGVPPPGNSKDGSGSYGTIITPQTTTIYSSPESTLNTIDQRMIQRTGDMAIVVQDVKSAIDYITGLTNSSQGYVVNSNTWKVGDGLNGVISIRVPAEAYSSILESIRSIAVEVTTENTSANDVTEQYVDLQAQLSNQQATEQQLLNILTKATTVDEILKVQMQLSATRNQIEQLKGQMQYLEKTTATSLLTVNLQQSKLYAKIGTDRSVVSARENITFYANISGGFAPYSYQWDFGDGTTSTNTQPAHSYAKVGNYTIKLTVTDDKGNKVTDTRQNYINVVEGWNAGNTGRSAWNGLVGFGHLAIDVLIWLGIFSPVWIIAGVIIFLVVRRNKKRRISKS
jgi:PKD repeat protein